MADHSDASPLSEDDRTKMAALNEEVREAMKRGDIKGIQEGLEKLIELKRETLGPCAVPTLRTEFDLASFLTRIPETMAVGLQQSEDLMARLQALPLPRGPSDLIYLVLDVHLLLVFAHTQAVNEVKAKEHAATAYRLTREHQLPSDHASVRNVIQTQLVFMKAARSPALTKPSDGGA